MGVIEPRLFVVVELRKDLNCIIESNNLLNTPNLIRALVREVEFRLDSFGVRPRQQYCGDLNDNILQHQASAFTVCFARN